MKRTTNESKALSIPSRHTLLSESAVLVLLPVRAGARVLLLLREDLHQLHVGSGLAVADEEDGLRGQSTKSIAHKTNTHLIAGLPLRILLREMHNLQSECCN
jgi:hypothetical protein